ncbi:MAG: DNA gyrase inhibitor YacG [Rhodospirillaceae bacterium]
MSADDSNSDSSPAEETRPSGVRVTAAKCVRCGQPVQARFRPFCSQRCQDVDLGAWATGAYRVPGASTPTDDFGGGETEE